MKRQENRQITVGRWILQKVNTANWRTGKMTGCKHYNHKDKDDSLRLIMEDVGSREQFMKQVRDLEHSNLISVKYGNVSTTVENITISMEQIDRLCAYEGVKNEKNIVAERKKFLEAQMQQTTCDWLISYEKDLYKKLERGTIDNNVMDDNIFKLLQKIASLHEDIWKRKFSHDVLGNSKTFENVYENKIITILIKYSPKVDECLREDYQEKEEDTANEAKIQIKNRILAEHGIITYSQTLQWKGGIVYSVGDGTIDTSLHPYGVILNAQSLEHAKLISLKDVKRIITIENQANYEDMQYDPQVLYIFTHGFFSPKERAFLLQISMMADENVRFEHWSDLDYGGIRIFQFIQNKVFPKVHPLLMDATTYQILYTRNTEGIALTDSKRKKLEKMDAGELDDLKQCILKYGIEFEQESLIGDIEHLFAKDIFNE